MEAIFNGSPRSNALTIMNLTSPSESHLHPNAVTMQVILLSELIVEVLSFLPVKYLLRMKCVCKSWNTLISEPFFIKMHLKLSARNPHLALPIHIIEKYTASSIRGAVPIPVSHLLENHPIRLPGDLPCSGLVIGSCNGLLLFRGLQHTHFYTSVKFRETCFRISNPVTRKVSKNIVSFHENFKDEFLAFRFTFGYDDVTNTYKVVAFRPGDMEVRVVNLGDNVWRDIQSLPVTPYFDDMNYGVYLSGSIYWLALYNYSHPRYEWEGTTVDQFVIISLNLRTETYTKLLLPRGFNEVTRVPILRVLNNRLLFSHDFKGTHLIIWQMTEYGVEESWNQLLKISYQNLPSIHHSHPYWVPLYFSEICDILIFAKLEDQAILYNWRNNAVERTKIKLQNRCGYMPRIMLKAWFGIVESKFLFNNLLV